MVGGKAGGVLRNEKRGNGVEKMVCAERGGMQFHAQFLSHARSHSLPALRLHCSASASEVDGEVGVPAKSAPMPAPCANQQVRTVWGVALSIEPALQFTQVPSPGLLPSDVVPVVCSHRVLAPRTPRRPLRNRRCQNIRNFADSRFGLARLIEGWPKVQGTEGVSPTSSLPRGSIQINGGRIPWISIPVVGTGQRN